MNPNVLVTDGDNRATLAITRSLGSKGYRVFVGNAGKASSLAGLSRYCIGRMVYADPIQNANRFRKDIIRYIKEKNIGILMPAAETTTLQCMMIKSELADRCVVPFQSHELVSQAASKHQVLQMAEKLEIPIPETFTLYDHQFIDDAIAFCNRIGYPVVIKPSRSRLDQVSSLHQSRAQYAASLPEVHRIVGQYNPVSLPLLIQERIYGAGVGIFACFDNGHPIAFFSHRRIREKPPSGGVSVLRRSFPVNPQLRAYSNALLKELKWHGVAMVEFKKDDRTGGYRLMEINGRFWGSLQLAIDAGVDFPWLLARIAEGQSVQPLSDYNLNIQTRWLWGDIDALLSRLFKSKHSLNLPPGFPSKMDYLRSFMQFDPKTQKLEVFRWNDPVPFAYETLQWLKIIR